jgi:diaminopimelate decarboxylase
VVELESCTRATLGFDLATIAANLDAVATAARASEIRVLFAAKSFPHPRVLELAAEKLDGFDVASQGELAMVPTDKIISICDPSARALGNGARTIVSVETAAQLASVPAGAEIAIRISASITGRDPAVGAILDGSGYRRSRFGLEDRGAVAAIVEACGRRVGLHLHHGPITATSPERFIASARAALDLIDFEPAFLNLGGAWHGIADLAVAFATIRAAVPRSIELLIEPGRVFSARAGFACGIVTAARSLPERELRVLDLSRACHLRWSPVELVAPAPHPGRGRKVLLVGPTCYEEDTIGEWTIDPDHVERRAILKDVPGYALAWNTGFGGVPPADVIVR